MNTPFEEGMVLCQACHFNKFWQNLADKRYCLNCLESLRFLKPQLVASKSSEFEPEMLRRLIQLTHPDRHQGSMAAHIASQYLQKLKSLSSGGHR